MAASATVVAPTVASSTQRVVTVGAIQLSCVSDIDTNCRRAEERIREAARKGANIVLVPELFVSLYFPIDQIDCLRLAVSLDDEKSYVSRFQNLARELNIVLPISFYERANNVYFNSVLIIDADGSRVGMYRKSHIPNDLGYQEKFYFSPGDTGFRVFKTRYAVLGLGISSDQWYPEAARVLALQGAELLLYPSAKGSEPQDPALDTCAQWQRCMQGHASANMVPVIAANRVGKEHSCSGDVAITFYGSSFMTDHRGGIVSDAGRHQEIVLTHMYNLDEIHTSRYRVGLFRDRRPELYTLLCSFDGHIPHVVSTSNRQLGVTPTVGNNVTGGMSVASMGITHPSLQHAPFISQTTHMGLVPTATTVGPMNSAAVAVGGANAITLTSLTPGKKMEPEAVLPPHTMMNNMLDDAQRRVVGSTFDMHEASFIGEVKGNSQRRPRGRCWVCRAKTTYECKLCTPGPVPLCNRTARECWWKYHAGEITPYVPNKRGRKRRKIDPVSLSVPLEATEATVISPQLGETDNTITASASLEMPAASVPAPTQVLEGVELHHDHIDNEDSDDVGDDKGMHQGVIAEL